MNRIPENIASRIYSILIEHAGAPDTPDSRYGFIHYFSRSQEVGTPSEYRCCGKFGFAGKFWWNNDRFYVSGHSRGDRMSEEFLEAERAEIDGINALLAPLYAEFLEQRTIHGIMQCLPALDQHQGALNDQLRMLIPIANKLGLQDAADFIARSLDRD